MLYHCIMRYAVSLCNVLPTIGPYQRNTVSLCNVLPTTGQYLRYAVSLCNVLPTIEQYLHYAVSLCNVFPTIEQYFNDITILSICIVISVVMPLKQALITYNWAHVF